MENQRAIFIQYERTPKRFKKLILIGQLWLMLATALLLFGDRLHVAFMWTGFAMLPVWLIYMIVVGLLKWWHHG